MGAYSRLGAYSNKYGTSTCLFTFSVVVVDLSIDCILSFLFPAETDVLVPVLSQSTDVVVVNFVVVLKFPIDDVTCHHPNRGSNSDWSSDEGNLLEPIRGIAI